MNSQRISRQGWSPLGNALIIAFAVFGLYSVFAATTEVVVTLSGDQEVPPVKSAGNGSGLLVIAADRTVSGSVTTLGISGTMAHIHEAAPDKNGPVIIALTKDRDGDHDRYTVPAGAKLTDAQFASFQAGNLYINVHTAAHAAGEIRGQLKP